MLETKVEELKDEIKQMTNNMGELMCNMLLIEEENYYYKSASHDGGLPEEEPHVSISSQEHEEKKKTLKCDDCKFTSQK